MAREGLRGRCTEEDKTPGQISPGHEPVKVPKQLSSGPGAESILLWRRSPVRDLLATFPTRTGKAVDLRDSNPHLGT
jgi:hypothetical protein